MNRVYTETTCERCPNIERREGECDGLPEGWAENRIVTSKDVEIVTILCPSCSKTVEDILANPKAKVLKVRGKDKKPRRTALQGQGKASEIPVVETPIPIKKRGKGKGKIEEFTPEETAARIRKSQGQYCVGCKEEKACILTGTLSLDCWMQKTMDRKE